MSTTPRKAYTVSEVAEMLSLHPQHVYRLIKTGKLAVIDGLGERTFRIAATEVDRYIADNQSKSTAATNG